MSKFIRHLPCPKCNSKDNLGEYDDHLYCFGCQYYKSKDDLQSIRNRLETKNNIEISDPINIDISYDIPSNAMKWLLSYGISLDEIHHYKFGWSAEKRALILLHTKQYWQGRSFGYGPKYISYGLKPLTIYGAGGTIVLVEDILSAIKVARTNVSATPLLGSSLSVENERSLAEKYDTIYVWLDRDKAKNAVKIKNRLKSLGVYSKAIITDKDPKEYTTQEIEQWLKNK